MRRIFLFLSVVLLNQNANAVLTINSVSGVSSFTIVGNTTASTTPGSTTTTPATGTASVSALGGLAGTACLGASSGVTCNSCLSNTSCADNSVGEQFPLCACNEARIWDNLIITVSVTPGTGDTGLILATGGGTTTGSPTGVLTQALPSTTTSVSFFWREVCGRLGGTGGNSCEGLNLQGIITVFSDNNNDQQNVGESSVPITFRTITTATGTAGSLLNNENVYGSPTTEGIGAFTPFPGDERIYFTDVNTTSGFPALSYGSSATAVRVFLSTKDLDDATSKLRDMETDVTINSTGDSLDSDFVDNVQNLTTYFVRVALVDQAANVVQFYPDITATAQSDPFCFAAGPPDGTKCRFAVKPDPVLGLLTKDFNCFIATAAYGSPLEPKLELFRKFRRQILLRSDWGRKFVMNYYAYGPYAARYISDKPVLRALTRGLLWPFAGFTWLALKIGFAKSLAISLLLLTTAIALTVLGARRISPRV